MALFRLKSQGPLNALSYSSEYDSVVVAGREVLSIISSETGKIVNLRVGSKLNLNYSSNDVKWSPHYAKDTIVTAATNGSIVVWNVEKARQDRVITEHQRAVNRISFHNKEPVVLVSASQDGLVKIWDLRDKSKAKLSFDGKSESVRDVQFNPMVPHEFAASYENGCIQKWDLRNPSIFEHKISAHNGIALCIDWRPDGKFLASGGRDKLIKIWDMIANERKPRYHLQMIASVGRVKWRPDYETQLAACSLLTDYRIHIWDITCPYISKLCFEDHENVTTGINWKSSEILQSVSKDKSFVERSIQQAYSPVNLVPRTNCDWDVSENLVFCVSSSIKVPTSHHSGQLSNSKKIPIPPPPNQVVKRLTSTISSRKNAPPLSASKPSEESVVLEVLQNQFSHHVKFDFMGEEVFKHLAKSYLFHDEDGKCSTSIPEKLTFNENLCSSLSLSHYANIWAILREIVNEYLSCSNPNLSQFLLCNLKDFLEDLCENGQIQIVAVFILSVQSILDDGTMMPEVWISQYIDLLQRYRLWAYANAAIKYSKFDSIKRRNQQSTLFQISCSICSKVVSRNSEAAGTASVSNNHNNERKERIAGTWICKRCKNYVGTCSICRLPVKKLFLWCKGCGHGGHSNHIQQWFNQRGRSSCPSGCGHQCTMTE